MPEKKEHSVKVPKLYKAASKIAKTVKEEGGSVKQLVYNLKHYNTKALYALVLETLGHGQTLDSLLRGTQILIKEKMDPWLARVLITELLWGKQRLPADSKPIQTVLAYEASLRSELTALSPNIQSKHEKASKPRYIRVNTLAFTVQEAILYFENEGWHKTVCSADDYPTFLSQVSSLNENQFAQDFHLEDLLVFPAGTAFFQHELYLDGFILLQDKASCLPSFLLEPTPGSIVLDMCAAPGMKTSHLAALMNNKGMVYAIEKNKDRYDTLCQLMETVGASCVKPIHGDAMEITPKQCPNVEYILVDPSCSGSGYPERMNESYDPARLRKLADFQAILLRKALTRFPNVRRVVYSTCSLLPEENEQVVEEVLNSAPAFQLVRNLLNVSWPGRGGSEYSCGPHCLYAHPGSDLTNGFFIAVFEKIDSNVVTENDPKTIKKHKVKKPKRDNINMEIMNEDEDNHNMMEEVGKKSCQINERDKNKKRKKKYATTRQDSYYENDLLKAQNCRVEVAELNVDKCEKSKKHKKKKQEMKMCEQNIDYKENLLEENENHNELNIDEVTETAHIDKRFKKHKKRKRNKSLNEDPDTELEVNVLNNEVEQIGVESITEKKKKKERDHAVQIVDTIQLTKKNGYKEIRDKTEAEQFSSIGRDKNAQGADKQQITREKKKKSHKHRKEEHFKIGMGLTEVLQKTDKVKKFKEEKTVDIELEGGNRMIKDSKKKRSKRKDQLQFSM